MAARYVRIGQHPDYRDEIRGTLSEILASTANPGTYAAPEDVTGTYLEMGSDGLWSGASVGNLTKAQADAVLAAQATKATLKLGTVAAVNGSTVTWRGVGAGWAGGNLFDAAKNQNAFAVMASPPTVADSTTNPQASGQFFAATGSSITDLRCAGTPQISFFRGANYVQGSLTSPRYGYVTAETFTGAGVYSSLSLQFSSIHIGSKITLSVRAGGGSLVVKIDDKALPVIVPPNDGSLRFYTIDFGSVNERRIDVIAKLTTFGGFYVDSADGLIAAPRRGPRTVVFSDSFGEGTGVDAAGDLSWIECFAEYLGWDDVISSAVGATGLIAATSPKVNWVSRAYRDAGQVDADLIIVKLSVNDASYTPQELVTAIDNFIKNVRMAGCGAQIVLVSSTTSGGYGRLTTNQIDQNKAAKAYAEQNGISYINSMDVRLRKQFAAPSVTLAANCANGATSLTVDGKFVVGSNYAFADGYGFFVRSQSGSVATVSPIYGNHNAGEIIEQIGYTTITGNGRVGATTGWGSADVCITADGTHPTTRGHKTIGTTDAMLFIESVA